MSTAVYKFANVFSTVRVDHYPLTFPLAVLPAADVSATVMVRQRSLEKHIVLPVPDKPSAEGQKQCSFSMPFTVFKFAGIFMAAWINHGTTTVDAISFYAFLAECIRGYKTN
jgi:hypothetical protein